MITNKVALITGGSGGIGSEVCRYLARAHYQVVVNYQSSLEKASATLASLENEGHSIFRASVTDRQELEDMAAHVARQYGRLDLLVNNAGITTPVPHNDLDALDDDWIDHILQVNFRGAFATIRAFKSLLLKGHQPVVINMSSVAARTGIGSNVAYCASKAALDSLTRSLGRALAPAIRVVSLSPGWVQGEYAGNFPAEYLQKQIDHTPLNRLAQAKDVAIAVRAIAESFTFSTGCVFPVDGGRELL